MIANRDGVVELYFKNFRDMMATLEALDDEQTEPKIAVQGDLVMEKHVENEVNGVAESGIGINLSHNK